MAFRKGPPSNEGYRHIILYSIDFMFQSGMGLEPAWVITQIAQVCIMSVPHSAVSIGEGQR